MVVIVVPKEETEMIEEIRRILVSELYTYTYKIGIPFGFLVDSKSIQEALDTIAERTTTIYFNVKLDKLAIEANKKHEEIKKLTGDENVI